MRLKGTKNFTHSKRLQLEAYLHAKMHKKDIAKNLGVSLTTIYNEIHRGEYLHTEYRYTDEYGEKHYKDVVRYSSDAAEEYTQNQKLNHGKGLKIGNDYAFVRYVEKRILEDKISPSAIVGEIKRGNLFRTIISKTTMYRYIEQGIFLHVRFSDLPQGKRKQQYRKVVAKKLPKGTSIEQRDADILSREEFGHWEMDCVVGKKKTKSVLLCMTERRTRYEIIFLIPDRKTSSVVNCINSLEKEYGKKFSTIFKSITVDNGSEFADFNGIQTSLNNEIRTRIYYCHPYTSCERGSNERLNRDIRRWCPKGTDFSSYSNAYIKFVQNWINNYPREIFDFVYPAKLFAEELAKL